MVIAIMIVVLGLIGIQNTPIEQYPDITPPMVQVSADYQGADALTVGAEHRHTDRGECQRCE